VSEPLVKEELAIVEFLTAKTNPTKPASAPSDPAQRNSADDQTPVDLLLGLAKTRSGRRAAEEEKRQLRLQAVREAQEKAAAGRANGLNSPWGYQAPPMPGLDVHQPFGNPATNQRQPRPLQPPPSKRPSGMTNDWSPDQISFDGVNLMQPTAFQSRSPDTVFSDNPNQNQGREAMQTSPYQNMVNLPLASPNNMSLPGLGADVFASMQVDGGVGLGQGQQVQMQQQQQFRNARGDGFDFDLGLGAAQPFSGESQFNPFALPQTEEG
jgi:hypothetical protein